MAGGKFLGHINARNPTGLTPLGGTALRAMMKLGMIIDVDHMSDRAVNSILQVAEGIPFGGYPLVSGHSGIRDGGEFNAENARTPAQLQRIGCLQGMFGVGTAAADASGWAAMYSERPMRSTNRSRRVFRVPTGRRGSGRRGWVRHGYQFTRQHAKAAHCSTTTAVSGRWISHGPEPEVRKPDVGLTSTELRMMGCTRTSSNTSTTAR